MRHTWFGEHLVPKSTHSHQNPKPTKPTRCAAAAASFRARSASFSRRAAAAASSSLSHCALLRMDDVHVHTYIHPSTGRITRKSKTDAPPLLLALRGRLLLPDLLQLGRLRRLLPVMCMVGVVTGGSWCPKMTDIHKCNKPNSIHPHTHTHAYLCFRSSSARSASSRCRRRLATSSSLLDRCGAVCCVGEVSFRPTSPTADKSVYTPTICRISTWPSCARPPPPVAAGALPLPRRPPPPPPCRTGEWVACCSYCWW